MNKLDQAKRLQDRTKKFAIRIIKAFARLPKDEVARTIGRQFLRSGTSVAANSRAACRARSRLISFPKSASSLKKSMKRSFGSNVGRSRIGRHEVDRG
jgi:hypothetical protein